MRRAHASTQPWFSSSCSTGTSRHDARRARPCTILRAGTSCVTTEPAATSASSPIVDAGQHHRAGADAAALLHRHALEVLEALGRAAHEVVVRGHHARRDEHAVLERRVGGDVALALELAVAADGAEVLDRDAAADDRAAADRDVLAHGAQVGHQHLARRSRPRDRAPRRCRRCTASPTVSGGSSCSFVVAEFAARIGSLPSVAWSSMRTSSPTTVSSWITTWWPTPAAARRAGRSRRSRSTRPACVPSPITRARDGSTAAHRHRPPAVGAIAHRRAAGARATPAPPPARCTTRSPSSPSVSGVLRSRTHSTKCWHSSRERLLQRDLRNQDVAAAHRERVAVRHDLARRGRRPCRRCAIFSLASMSSNTDHLLAADHGELAQLVRVEPRHVHVRHAAAREAQVHEHDVLDLALQERRAARRRRRAAPRRAGGGSPTGRAARSSTARSRRAAPCPGSRAASRGSRGRRARPRSTICFRYWTAGW